MDQDGYYYPDSVVGTDSHTTMIDGLGVLGWGMYSSVSWAVFCLRELAVFWAWVIWSWLADHPHPITSSLLLFAQGGKRTISPNARLNWWVETKFKWRGVSVRKGSERSDVKTVSNQLQSAHQSPASLWAVATLESPPPQLVMSLMFYGMEYLIVELLSAVLAVPLMVFFPPWLLPEGLGKKQKALCCVRTA